MVVSQSLTVCCQCQAGVQVLFLVGNDAWASSEDTKEILQLLGCPKALSTFGILLVSAATWSLSNFSLPCDFKGLHLIFSLCPSPLMADITTFLFDCLFVSGTSPDGHEAFQRASKFF